MLQKAARVRERGYIVDHSNLYNFTVGTYCGLLLCRGLNYSGVLWPRSCIYLSIFLPPYGGGCLQKGTPCLQKREAIFWEETNI